MKRWTKRVDNYLDITSDDNVVVAIDQSGEFIAELGIPGEIVHMPGHSDDSATLVLDNFAAFTEDLTWPSRVALGDPAVVVASWEELRSHGAKTVYGGHRSPWQLADLC